MAHPQAQPANVGALLQFWRRTRNLSQLALAHEANISPRHVSFVETGRAKPSRRMVLQLAETLAVPFRERNELLLAAGFAPVYREATLDDADLAPVRIALDAILRQQEPFPAVAMNRRWDIVATNESASRFFNLLLAGHAPADLTAHPNVLRLMFDPRGLRPAVTNWNEVAPQLLQRVHREAVGGVVDATTRKLLDEVRSYPGVPERWQAPDTEKPLLPVLPIRFRTGDRAFDFFSAVTVLGTPQDVTSQELRIECFFPADDATASAARELAGLPRSG